MSTLSVIIPARNEEWLNRTIADILSNIEGDTDIILILDGYWPTEPIPDNPKVTIVHHTNPIGQRAATNEGARISQAKYVMKADGHCAFDKGFDVKLMADCQSDWTVIPEMYNLHIFNWKCQKCGNTTYQDRKPVKCKDVCDSTDFQMEMVWQPRSGSYNYCMRFDKELIFQYWKEHKSKERLVETMSFIGACWFMELDRYWELEGLDEKHGFWGQVGTEVACKTWLSGGKLICNRNTWFAHFFRTQFGWPYRLTQGMIDRARAYSRDLWFNNKWPKQKYQLKWLVDKFAPVPGWENYNWNGGQ